VTNISLRLGCVAPGVTQSGEDQSVNMKHAHRRATNEKVTDFEALQTTSILKGYVEDGDPAVQVGVGWLRSSQQSISKHPLPGEHDNLMKGVLTARIHSCKTWTVWSSRDENSRPALLAAVGHYRAVRRVLAQVRSTQPTLSYL